MRYLLFLALSASLFAGSLFAQPKLKPADYGIKSKKALKLYEEGMTFARYRDRNRAIQSYQAALNIEPDFAHAHNQLGIVAHATRRYDKAEFHLSRAYELMPEAFTSLTFYLGQTYFALGQYSEATDLLEQFVKAGKGRRYDRGKAAFDLRHARYSMDAIKDSLDFQPQNLGPTINTQFDEYLPFLTADDSYLLFTSRRPESVGGYNSQLMDYSEDFFVSTYEEEAWTKVKNLGNPINTPDNEGAAAITQDGRTIFFTACNRPSGLGGCDIYMSVREGNKWSEPVNLGPSVNSKDWDSQPCLSGDGKTLYFTSNRPGGVGNRDIWYSRLEDGRWSPAQNLGEPINTAGDETAPFLHADDVSLYFASTFHEGFGGKDIFVAYLEETGWTSPKNLGYPLNTKADESHLFVNSQGRIGFINSDREGGYGGSDLYQFELDARIRPKIATFLRGLVRDSITQEPLAAKLNLIDVEKKDTVRQAITDVDGSFLMSLPLDRAYAAFVEAEGYLFTTTHFYLKELEETPYFDVVVEMKPLKKDVQVVLSNIFFETNSADLQATSDAELQFLVNFLEKNPSIRIEIQGHTDDIGGEEYNLNLSQKRAESVKNHLIEAGIGETRIEAKGYGETRPVAGNITDEDRAQNRRTEFKILETGE
ncbi:MAG: OmpA family protein [Bacteroidota bacterium]